MRTAVKTEEKKAPKKSADVLVFCPMCFASNEGGSWGDGCDEGHCFNCGASNSTVKLPRWAIDSIRQQASWVGKRFYAHDEDKNLYEEIRHLRGTIKEFPGRSVERTEDGTAWWVHQELPGGLRVSIVVEGGTKERALEKGRLELPYVPKK